ncbi:MAG TPA: hypothetical protein VK539_23445 [Myxococcaceae bacterium]|nr:hypothetical protein [Myxococcaceae bacterium]
MAGNDHIIILGMNKHTPTEATALKNANPKIQVTTIQDTFQNDTVKVQATLYDLSTSDGLNKFMAPLGLPAPQSARVKTAISGAGDDARDEIAQLALAWSKAEKGGTIPARFVLSGHSFGESIWGGDESFMNGTLTRKSLAQLAAAMPKAAAQVLHLCLAACYNGGKSNMEEWHALFPKLKTMWAYDGSAPGTFSGATAHLARWEKATRGNVEKLQPDLLKGLRKGDHLAVWSRLGGYQQATPTESSSVLRPRYFSGLATFNSHFRGESVVTNSQQGPLREHYNTIQALLGCTDITAAERKQFESARDQTIRLLFYKEVSQRFQQTYQAQIKSGFSVLKQTTPDFSKLSRKEALTVILSFESELSRRNPRPKEAQSLLPLLTQGLRDLQPSHIPENWI